LSIFFKASANHCLRNSSLNLAVDTPEQTEFEKDGRYLIHMKTQHAQRADARRALGPPGFVFSYV
jgi:hypothetical protein